MLNRVVLIGRLTADPTLRYTPSGKAVANFTLAVARIPKPANGADVDFINCVAWEKTAEACANYIGKGSLVAVDGKLQIRTYDAKDGTKRWVTEVIAEQVRFLDKKEAVENKEAGKFGDEVPFDKNDFPF